jgi:putative phosphoribosyl transferase
MVQESRWCKFRDRHHAGQLLAEHLLAEQLLAEQPLTKQPLTKQPLTERLVSHADSSLIVLALPRGGIPIGFEVAQRLQAPLDVCLVRKLGTPQNRELAMGAIAEDGSIALNPGVIDRYKISPTVLQGVIDAEQQELLKRIQLYQPYRPAPIQSWTNQIVILLDDGIATGATFQAAVINLQARNPARLIVATPVASPTASEQFSGIELVCLIQPDPLQAVGHWYHDFTQVSDQTVCHLLALANARAE